MPWLKVIAGMVVIIMAPVIAMFFVTELMTRTSGMFSFFNIRIAIGHVD
jgi:hypothetical protein